MLFKKEGKISVSFEGRELSREEIAQILFALNHLPETEVEFICDIPDKGRTEDLCNQIDIPPHRSKHRQPAAVGHTAHVDHVIRHEAPATDTAASNKKYHQMIPQVRMFHLQKITTCFLRKHSEWSNT